MVVKANKDLSFAALTAKVTAIQENTKGRPFAPIARQILTIARLFRIAAIAWDMRGHPFVVCVEYHNITVAYCFEILDAVITCSRPCKPARWVQGFATSRVIPRRCHTGVTIQPCKYVTYSHRLFKNILCDLNVSWCTCLGQSCGCKNNDSEKIFKKRAVPGVSRCSLFGRYGDCADCQPDNRR